MHACIQNERYQNQLLIEEDMVMMLGHNRVLSDYRMKVGATFSCCGAMPE